MVGPQPLRSKGPSPSLTSQDKMFHHAGITSSNKTQSCEKRAERQVTQSRIYVETPSYIFLRVYFYSDGRKKGTFVYKIQTIFILRNTR